MPRAGPLLALALALAACGAPPATPDSGDATLAGCGAGAGQLEVGRGGSRPLALRDGDELPIVLGAQGGIHVVVAAWIWDMDLDAELRYRLVDDSGERVGTETVVALRPSILMPDGPRYVRHPDLVVLDGERPSVEEFAGRTVTLEAEARSADGSHPCDARSVILTEP